MAAKETSMDIQGFCDPRFESVRQAFLANFDGGNEVGASVAVTLDGVPVVDLWAGDADSNGRPWQEDTIVNVYSTTKTMAGTCMLMLADRGSLEFDAPVATYWPEFAANGKQGVLVKHVMSHSAGLSGFDPPLETADDLYDWDAIVSRLAAQAPWWSPGEGSGYHAVTQGFLQGEIVRRVTGKSIGTFFREEVAEPLGADFHIGLDPAHDGRVGELIPPGSGPNSAQGDPDSIGVRTMTSCPITGKEPRTSAWRRAEIPAAGGQGNARSVARVHSALACGGEVDGVRLLSEAGVARALEEQTQGKDRVLGVPIRFGMGFGLVGPTFPLSPNPRTFFWGGWGGSLAVIDLDARMSVAYVMNKMAANIMGDVRGGSIVLSAYKALEA
ncbi:MAG: beta-lactamase family protein [Deltaproteobacteria bacterium]|nr:beta-lactamase family protein [Deltaproteobacteria bacterium]MBW2392712.1 beta-lactamase family protein [Deltaproteobacteria bacterium]